MTPSVVKLSCVRRKCALTGSTSDLEIIRLIHDHVATNGDERQMACMEWAWGLPRGGLVYYLISTANAIMLSTKMANILCSGHIMLFPTFKTFADALDFSERTGIQHRAATDRSPRRPLTALHPPDQPYRYIVFALTDTGRRLQNQMQLSSQTEEDWNRGVHPVTGKRLDRRTRSYPVLETHTHPASVCFNANAILGFMGRTVPDELRPWKQCLARFCDLWGIGSTTSIVPPQWFIDEDEKHMDDQSLCGSEASGYLPIPESDGDCRPPRYVSSDGTDDSHYSARVSNWLGDVTVPKVRRSKIPRLVSLMKGSRIDQLLGAPALPKGDYSSSPMRKVRDPAMDRRALPSRVKRGYNVPSQTFTSSDWALFCYGVSLEAPRPSQRQTSATHIPRLHRPSRRA
ncbi:hypothetical protein K525DRAFT_266387 [Schizophyllum commune Loenen D]|nr:hypothetical protein K525DRAFT_266387 [Schizophyllum commune Loenen D]